MTNAYIIWTSVFQIDSLKLPLINCNEFFNKIAAHRLRSIQLFKIYKLNENPSQWYIQNSKCETKRVVQFQLNFLAMNNAAAPYSLLSALHAEWK